MMPVNKEVCSIRVGVTVGVVRPQAICATVPVGIHVVGPTVVVGVVLGFT